MSFLQFLNYTKLWVKTLDIKGFTSRLIWEHNRPPPYIFYLFLSLYCSLSLIKFLMVNLKIHTEIVKASEFTTTFYLFEILYVFLFDTDWVYYVR